MGQSPQQGMLAFAVAPTAGLGFFAVLQRRIRNQAIGFASLHGTHALTQSIKLLIRNILPNDVPPQGG